MRNKPLILGWILSLGLALVSGSAVAQHDHDHGSAPAPSNEPVFEFGQPFPPDVFRNLNPEAGPTTMDLATDLGKRPILLVYWIAGNARSEKLLKDMENLVAEIGPDKVALYGVVFLQPNRGQDVVRTRLKAAGVNVPVFDDKEFRFGRRVRVSSVPNVTLIDKEGILRMTNAGSLRQSLESDLNLAEAVKRAASGAPIDSYGYLETYQPVEELVGKPCPNFKAKTLAAGSGEKNLTEMLASDKVNVLIYWSVECGHCRKYLPEVAGWIKENPAGLNVVTAATVPNEAIRVKTREFCNVKGIDFPTLMDQDHKIGELYQITSTPTILVIRPDGVVDKVLTGGEDFGEAIEAAKAKLLKG